MDRGGIVWPRTTEGRRPLEQLQPQSRVPTAHRTVNGAEVFIYEGDKQSVPQIRDDLRFSLAQLVVRLDSDAENPRAGIQEAMPVIDRVLESLSFQMQTALQIQGVSAIDLTGSPVVGEDFIFLWIACEILAARSDLTVSELYRGPACGHVIAACPECQAPTTKPVQGQSMKRWLTEGFGVDDGVAKRIWNARQMLHGAFAFDSRVMDDLPELAQWLRAVVVTEIKRRLGAPEHKPPFAAPTGLSISPYMGLSGSAKVSERDLRPLG